MKLESYWLDSAPRFTGAAEGPVEGRADVVVIGGGFTGLSAALALRRRGATVVVLEAGQVAGEASGRNGGQCNNGIAHSFAALVASYGAERARAIYRAFDAAVDTVETIVREENIACDFVRGGKLKLASKPKHFKALADTYENLHREVDPDLELVSAARIRDEVDSDHFHGGLIQKKSAQLHVGRFAVGLAEAAAHRGARIFQSAAVSKLERLSGSAYRVTTERGSIDAGQVLLATGASSNGPLGWFRRRLVPVGSFIVVTAPLERALLDRMLPKRRSYVTTRHIGNYFRVTPDNRLLFGGRARFAMSNPRSDEKSGHILKAGIEAHFPQLRGVSIDYCWGGLVDMTANRLPHAGEHEGLFYSLGYSGHGVQMSVHMGQVMSEVLDGRAASNPWLDSNWPAIPGNFGKPWFLPLVGAWYRLQDALD
jgi:glycine/D-amino acid oxidase-like deaminating enzyme